MSESTFQVNDKVVLTPLGKEEVKRLIDARAFNVSDPNEFVRQTFRIHKVWNVGTYPYEINLLEGHSSFYACAFLKEELTLSKGQMKLPFEGRFV